MATEFLPQVQVPTAIAPVSPTWRLWRAAWARSEFKVGLVIFVTLLALSILFPLLTDLSATKMVVKDKFLPPAFMVGGRWDHFLGTDQLGRDLFLRSLIGLQNALMIGIATVVIMFIVGCAIGLIAGYRGGWTDTILMRLTDAQLSIPLIILAITILTVSRPTPYSVVLVLALAGWPTYARITRAVTLVGTAQGVCPGCARSWARRTC